VVVAVTTAAAVVSSADDGMAAVAETAGDGGDGSDGGGGGFLDGVFPFKALQLYNAVASYLEYFYDAVIAPIAGNYYSLMKYLCRPTLHLILFPSDKRRLDKYFYRKVSYMPRKGLQQVISRLPIHGLSNEQI
jgi:hypothetical protein